jgi:hypothetical protein
MDVNIFALCYNEAALLPHMVNHYKKYIPSCKITILDNESTDNSVELAKNLGCEVVSWNSQNIMNEWLQQGVKNDAWKKINNGWIIIIDMDEFVCVSEKELLEEIENGTSILEIKGIDMIGESNSLDLTDIDLQEIKKYVYHEPENKKLCFLREKIKEMNYGVGAHYCEPVGCIQYSSKIYYNKHMSNLGLNFLLDKMKKRYERTEVMRSCGLDGHYTDNAEKIKTDYYALLNRSQIFEY